MGYPIENVEVRHNQRKRNTAILKRPKMALALDSTCEVTLLITFCAYFCLHAKVYSENKLIPSCQLIQITLTKVQISHINLMGSALYNHDLAGPLGASLSTVVVLIEQ